MREPAYPYHPGTVEFFHPWPTGHARQRVEPLRERMAVAMMEALPTRRDVLAELWGLDPSVWDDDPPEPGPDDSDGWRGPNVSPPSHWQPMWPYLGGPR